MKSMLRQKPTWNPLYQNIVIFKKIVFLNNDILTHETNLLLQYQMSETLKDR